jgi:hypothetical protein
MVWLPVIFVCLNSGACFFIYDETQVSEKVCQKVISEAGEKLTKQPELDGWKGACIPIKHKMI